MYEFYAFINQYKQIILGYLLCVLVPEVCFT